MTRNTVSAIGFATTLAVAVAATAIIASSAFAESTGEYTTPLVGAMTRAEVRNELLSQPSLLRAVSGESELRYRDQLAPKSALPKWQARTEYRAARREVAAVTGEDSGSAYFQRQARQAQRTTIMGGSAARPFDEQPSR
jgi:hypothetical protein